MQLNEHILTGNDCYKAGRTIKPQGIMVHSTGVAQPNVEVFLRTWDAPGVDACVHAFVHREGVTETLPWNWRGWHAGTGTSGQSANNTHISFEILEPAGHTYQGGTMIGYDVEKNAPYFAAVYHNAVELCAYLCTRYGFDPEQDILCHSEGYQQGIASGHMDVMHWFPKHGKDMDRFRADVKIALGGGEEMTQEQFNALFAAAVASREEAQTDKTVSAWAKGSWDKAVAAGLFDGTQPTAPLTREQCAVVLDRLGLIQES